MLKCWLLQIKEKTMLAFFVEQYCQLVGVTETYCSALSDPRRLSGVVVKSIGKRDYYSSLVGSVALAELVNLIFICSLSTHKPGMVLSSCSGLERGSYGRRQGLAKWPTHHLSFRSWQYYAAGGHGPWLVTLICKEMCISRRSHLRHLPDTTANKSAWRGAYLTWLALRVFTRVPSNLLSTLTICFRIPSRHTVENAH